MNDCKFSVPSLPEGAWKGTVVRRDTAWHGPKVSVDFFIADEKVRDFPAGHVFVLNRDSLNLLSSWGSNEKTRRRWARLSKTPYPQISAAIKARRAKESSENAQRRIEQARRTCEKFGYRMTKR